MNYVSIKLTLEFERKFKFHIRPLYLMRSLIGQSLHALCCSNREEDSKGKCMVCPLCYKCLYSTFFDGNIEGSRNKISSFSLHVFDILPKGEVDEYSFIIRVYGKAIENVPYVIAALVRSGGIGAGKDKVRFSLKAEDQSGDDFNRRNDSLVWGENPEDYSEYEGEVLVQLKTPFRLQIDHKYVSDFNAVDFFRSIYRRYESVIAYFGDDKPFEFENISDSLEIVSKRMKWNEAGHWSSRQQAFMQLGGVIGSFILKGRFSPFEMMLLDFAEKFSAGKNVTFGFGNMEIWSK